MSKEKLERLKNLMTQPIVNELPEAWQTDFIKKANVLLDLSREIGNKCVLCDLAYFQLSVDGRTCIKCRDKALLEAIDVEVHVNDYIDGLIVAKELIEEQIPDYMINLKVRKSKQNNTWVQQSFTLKYEHSSNVVDEKSNCLLCDSGHKTIIEK